MRPDLVPATQTPRLEERAQQGVAGKLDHVPLPFLPFARPERARGRWSARRDGAADLGQDHPWTQPPPDRPHLSLLSPLLPLPRRWSHSRRAPPCVGGEATLPASGPRPFRWIMCDPRPVRVCYRFRTIHPETTLSLPYLNHRISVRFVRRASTSRFRQPRALPGERIEHPTLRGTHLSIDAIKTPVTPMNSRK
eukprot:gene11983-biopygen13980